MREGNGRGIGSGIWGCCVVEYDLLEGLARADGGFVSEFCAYWVGMLWMVYSVSCYRSEGTIIESTIEMSVAVWKIIQ